MEVEPGFSSSACKNLWNTNPRDEMDISDATKVLLGRIRELEPEIAYKIVGCIFMQDDGEREMIRLAYAPDKLLENFVYETKHQLVSNSLPPPITVNPSPEVPLNYMPFSPNGSGPYSSTPTLRVPPTSYWDPRLSSEQQSLLCSDFGSLAFGDSVAEVHNQAQFVGFEDRISFPNNFYYPDVALGNLSLSLPEFPIKTCHYFNKGFCKHGNSCRYLHNPDHLPPNFGPSEIGEDHMFSPGSLEKLEVEISELLKSRRGNPVSIASLPMLYYEKYGRTLQAEGYLTESQRHGRAGYSLTKLLAHLKTIRLIDRPHGQHSLILAEDAFKYNLENRSDRSDPGPIVNGSRQIYLTFPAESTFTEEDVSNYFSIFGLVEDVRIPCQQKRMFGFVTFASANTVKIVLGKGNPHFVCGSRVLVKPYREKSKPIERKYMEKNGHGMFYPGNYLEIEPNFHPKARCEAPRFLRRQLMEEREREHALEMERRRLSKLQLGCKHVRNRQCVGHATEKLNVLEDSSGYPASECYQCMLDVINNNSNDDRSNHLDTDYTDQESSNCRGSKLPEHSPNFYACQSSQGINLPDSPFATATGSISLQ